MITKEQWEGIEDNLKGLFGKVDFKLDDKKITVCHEFIAQEQMGYTVYVDGCFKMGWAMPSSELYDPIVEKICNKRTRSFYSTKEKQQLTKIWGKRAVKKHHDLDKKSIHYEPYFKKCSVLLRQFKKIEELEMWSEE